MKLGSIWPVSRGTGAENQRGQNDGKGQICGIIPLCRMAIPAKRFYVIGHTSL